MPIYTYVCHECNDRLERIGVPVDARDKQTCENCGEVLERKLDAPGSVWHPTRSS